MGNRHNCHYTFVARNGRDQEFSQFLKDILNAIPLDHTCKVKIDTSGFDYTSREEALDWQHAPLRGSVNITFSTLYFLDWKSPTYDAAKKLVESKRYISTLAYLASIEDDAMIFGLVPFKKIATCFGDEL